MEREALAYDDCAAQATSEVGRALYRLGSALLRVGASLCRRLERLDPEIQGEEQAARPPKIPGVMS
jgi:hypothetical protein